MPKQIPNLKEMLISEGREVLQETGYSGFTMRYVAGRCGIGIGTAYNYFENKDMLLAVIMLEDWKKELESYRNGINAQNDPLKKAGILYECISGFSSRYEEVWQQYAGSRHSSCSVSDDHDLLVNQLCDFTGLRAFIVEIIIHFSTFRQMTFEELEPELKKLLG